MAEAIDIVGRSFTAIEMRVKKKELGQSEAEVTKAMEAVSKLQKRLQDAEKLLVRPADTAVRLLTLCHTGEYLIPGQGGVKIS